MKLNLTQQQRDALHAYKEGKSSQEIALMLNVSYQELANIFTGIMAQTPYKSKKELLDNLEDILIDS